MTWGYSTEQIFRRVGWLVMFSCFYGMVLGMIVVERHYFAFLITLVVLICIFAFLALKWGKEVIAYAQGIRGEIKVAAILALLPPHDYWAIHDVILPGQKGNIDHIVVGKTGIWLIETKHWSKTRVEVQGGKLLVDGYLYEEKELKKIRGKSLALYKHLRENGHPVSWVQPVLVFSTNTIQVDVDDRHENVFVAGFRKLNELIQTNSNHSLNKSDRTELKKILEKFGV